MKIEKKLNKMMEKAMKHDEVPVSALIIKNNKIISSAYNKKNKNKNVLDHAEIICMKKASKKNKKWNLSECDLYVTLKPCEMCQKIMNEFRIKNVYYYVDKNENKKEYNKTKIKKIDNLEEEEYIKNKLNIFFKQKRK